MYVKVIILLLMFISLFNKWNSNIVRYENWSLIVFWLFCVVLDFFMVVEGFD